MSHDVYLKLLEVAPRVHPLLPLALIVAEGIGRRISAWRNLVWDDIDFEAKTIHRRAEHDKKGYEQVVVMSDAVRDALQASKRRRRRSERQPYSRRRRIRRSRAIVICSMTGCVGRIGWPRSCRSVAGCGTRFGGSGRRSGRVIR